jgi:hypothetical protein
MQRARRQHARSERATTQISRPIKNPYEIDVFAHIAKSIQVYRARRKTFSMIAFSAARRGRCDGFARVKNFFHRSTI